MCASYFKISVNNRWLLSMQILNRSTHLIEYVQDLFEIERTSVRCAQTGSQVIYERIFFAQFGENEKLFCSRIGIFLACCRDEFDYVRMIEFFLKQQRNNKMGKWRDKHLKTY